MGNRNKTEGTKGKIKRTLEFITAIARPVREWVLVIVSCLGIITFVLGTRKYYSERQKEAAARYMNIMRDLGDQSDTVRAGAAITMNTHLKENYDKYGEASIIVLVNQFANEDSALVRMIIQEVLFNIGEKDKDDIVIQELVSSNRGLWEQSDLTPDAVIRGDPVSDKLQSITDALIKIFERKKTILPDLDMSKIYLTSDDYSLKEVKFMNVQLEGACLVRMNLEKVTMKGCKLNRALLDEAILKNACLAGAELKNAYLVDADLEGANLEGANLEGANLEGTDLEDANLEGANLEGANLEGTDLKGANLNNAILKDARLEYADLRGACLMGADMEEADLKEADLKGANLNNAILSGAYLKQAILVDAALKDANLTNAILEGADLEGADLAGADLYVADLRAAVLFSIDSMFQSDLDNDTISESFQKEFEDNQISLSKNTTVSVEQKDSRWLITDKYNEQTYTVRKEERLNICTVAMIVRTELFSIDSKKFQSDFDKGTISEDLRQEFENNGISLSQNTTVSIDEKDHTWLIADKDDEQTYTIWKEDGQLKIYEKTKLDPTELFSVDSKKFQSDLDKGTISEGFHQDFENKDISLSQNATVSIEEKNRRWLITDKDNKQTYTIKKEEWLNICKETKFDFTGIKKAENWDKAVFDDDIWEKLSGQKY